MRKETVTVESRYYPSIYLEGRGKAINNSVRIAGVPVQIRSRKLPNMSRALSGRPAVSWHVTVFLFVCPENHKMHREVD
jgi:hypothetical protein